MFCRVDWSIGTIAARPAISQHSALIGTTADPRGGAEPSNGSSGSSRRSGADGSSGSPRRSEKDGSSGPPESGTQRNCREREQRISRTEWREREQRISGTWRNQRTGAATKHRELSGGTGRWDRAVGLATRWRDGTECWS